MLLKSACQVALKDQRGSRSDGSLWCSWPTSAEAAAGAMNCSLGQGKMGGGIESYAGKALQKTVLLIH